MFEDIIRTCNFVCEKSKYVKINQERLAEFASYLKENNIQKHWLATTPLMDLEIDEIINFLVIYNSIDFSFWGDPKWSVQIEFKEIDGAYALLHCLLDFYKKNKSLDFENVSLSEFGQILKGNVQIPLLEERYHIVQEVSSIINKKMNGNFYLFIKDVVTDIELFDIIIRYFPSYEDIRIYQGRNIYFYKLAQLLVSDILHIRQLKEEIAVDYTHLVGCSDYKIPQVLRNFGVLEFDSTLSSLVDSKLELLENSDYEVEIRANTLVVINRITEILNFEICGIDINDMIWSLGQDKQKIVKPYHLTRTVSY